MGLGGAPETACAAFPPLGAAHARAWQHSVWRIMHAVSHKPPRPQDPGRAYKVSETRTNKFVALSRSTASASWPSGDSSTKRGGHRQQKQVAAFLAREARPGQLHGVLACMAFLRRRLDACCNVQMHRALAHLALREQSRGWHTWDAMVSERARQLLLLRKGLRHLANQDLSRGWAAWQRLVFQRAEARRLLRKGMAFLLQRQVAVAMLTWTISHPRRVSRIQPKPKWLPPAAGWQSAQLRRTPYSLRGISPIHGLSQREPWAVDVESMRGTFKLGPASAYATATLRSLDDGQNDDLARLMRRCRLEEHATRSTLTGATSQNCVPTRRPPWDSSAHHYVPPALKGLRAVGSVVREPWARDLEVYNQLEGGRGLACGGQMPLSASRSGTRTFEERRTFSSGGSRSTTTHRADRNVDRQAVYSLRAVERNAYSIHGTHSTDWSRGKQSR